MRRLGLIALAVVLALGGLGVGYAQWGQRLVANGTVATGDFDIQFTSANATPDAEGVTTLTGPTISNNGHAIDVGIGNTYPGYSQKVYFMVENMGTVPAYVHVTVTADMGADFSVECWESYPEYNWEGPFTDDWLMPDSHLHCWLVINISPDARETQSDEHFTITLDTTSHFW